MKVNEVKYFNDYTLFVSFDDGISGIIQLNDLVEHGIFQQLKNLDKFSKVYTTGFSIAWSEELEIDAASIYAELTGIIPSNYFNIYTNYASN